MKTKPAFDCRQNDGLFGGAEKTTQFVPAEVTRPEFSEDALLLRLHELGIHLEQTRDAFLGSNTSESFKRVKCEQIMGHMVTVDAVCRLVRKRLSQPQIKGGSNDGTQPKQGS